MENEFIAKTQEASAFLNDADASFSNAFIVLLTGVKTFVDLRKDFSELSVNTFPALVSASKSVSGLHGLATDNGLRMGLSKFKTYYATVSGVITRVNIDNFLFLILSAYIALHSQV